MNKKYCHPRGFYIYKIIQFKAMNPMVLNITLPSSEWDKLALKRIKESDDLLFHNGIILL